MGEDSAVLSTLYIYLVNSGQRQGLCAASLFSSYTLHAQRKSAYHSRPFSTSVINADIYRQVKLCKHVNSLSVYFCNSDYCVKEITEHDNGVRGKRVCVKDSV